MNYNVMRKQNFVYTSKSAFYIRSQSAGADSSMYDPRNRQVICNNDSCKSMSVEGTVFAVSKLASHREMSFAGEWDESGIQWFRYACPVCNSERIYSVNGEDLTARFKALRTGQDVKKLQDHFFRPEAKKAWEEQKKIYERETGGLLIKLSPLFLLAAILVAVTAMS